MAFLIFAFSIHQAYASDVEPIRLMSYKTHSRLSILIDQSVPVKWVKNKKGFKLEIHGITLNDLGVPVGQEGAWVKAWSGIRNSRLASFQVREKNQGVQMSGTWSFPKGRYELADPEMMIFEYRDGQKSQWVIDFWPKPGPTLVQKKEDEKKAKVQAYLKSIEEESKKRIARKLASVKKSDDEWMKKTVCQQPLNEQSEVFIQFLPTHDKFDFSPWFAVTRADEGFTYLKPTAHSTENQYVRLALKFYESGKTALALRTIEFFKGEFPKSPFLKQMMFLRANALIKLGLSSQGESALNQLMVDVRGQPIGFYSTKFVTQKLLNSGSHLAALQNFLRLIQDYPNHEEAWIFHLGAAEMLYALGETDRAAREYQWVEERAPERPLRAEAAYRIGDLYLARHQYEQALVSYHHAFEYFGEDQQRFPAYFLNKAEVYHQLGDLAQSRKLFEEFLKKFPHHSSGWKATLRLAEIAARDPQGRGQEDERYRAWLYQTINRYPFSPGVPLARIGLMPCGDHGGFDHKSATQYLTDEDSLRISSSEVSLKNYAEVKAISRIRSLIIFSEADQPIDVALDEYRIAQNPAVKKTLASLAHIAFRRRIQGLLKQEHKLEALSLYSKYFNKLPKINQEHDVDYLIQLSESALAIGLPRLASELVDLYRVSIVTGRLPASSQPGETPESIRAMLKASEESFAKAKSKWISIKDHPVNLAEFAEIRKHLSSLGDESEFSYEKELILGLMAERQGKFLQAQKHAQRAQLMKKSFLLDSWLASLELKLGHDAAALAIYENLESRIQTEKKQRISEQKPEEQDIAIKPKQQSESEEQSKSQETPQIETEKEKKWMIESTESFSERLLGVQGIETLEQLYLIEGSILEDQRRWTEAKSIYEKAIGEGMISDQAQFKLARCLYRIGGNSNREKAQEVLKKLSQSPGESGQQTFWKELAIEVLNNQRQVDSILNRAKEGKL